MNETNSQPQTGQKIEKLYAWIATEKDEGEGIISMRVGNTQYPMVGADVERMESLRTYARRVEAASGCPVNLVCFSTREVLE